MRKGKLTIKTGIRAGGIPVQHNRKSMKVSTGIRAGGIPVQHNRKPLGV